MGAAARRHASPAPVPGSPSPLPVQPLSSDIVADAAARPNQRRRLRSPSSSASSDVDEAMVASASPT